MQVSTIIGKRILTPAGESLGYVKDIFLKRDLSGLSCLCCIDTEEEEFILPVRTVKAFGDVVIAGKARLSSPTGMGNPIGKSVYSHKGELLGFVCDVLFEDEGAQIAVCKDTERNHFPASLVSLGETAIVYPDEQSKKSSAPKKKRSSPAKETSSPQQTQPEKQTPRDYPFGILGKTVKKTVYDSLGYPMIREGETVTADTVRKARRSNRLLQLTVNTLTNLP